MFLLVFEISKAYRKPDRLPEFDRDLTVPRNLADSKQQHAQRRTCTPRVYICIFPHSFIPRVVTKRTTGIEKSFMNLRASDASPIEQPSSTA